MTDNRTAELREKLTERGIEYETNDYMGVCETSWNGFTVMQLTPSAKLIMTVTPEQAIAATLGSDQELIDLAHNAWSMALCAMQGMPIPAEWGESVERGLREHGIDVDDEKAGFEVIDDER